MEKHHRLKTDIQRLTEEWENLSLEAERVDGEMEKAGIKRGGNWFLRKMILDTRRCPPVMDRFIMFSTFRNK